PTPPAPPSPGNPLCQNGIFHLNPNGQDIRTPVMPAFDITDFQVEVEFNLASFGTFGPGRPILMGGNVTRWIGLYVDLNGVICLKYNNSFFKHSTTTIQTNTWYSGEIRYENGQAQVLLNGNLIIDETVGPLNTGPFTDYNFVSFDNSNAISMHGCLRNLRVYSDTTLATPTNVPTLSQWGLIILGLLVLCIGAIKIRQIQSTTAYAAN
ncbi:MAG: IPTL-CTERM sorting domain-containing protein, partial [Bacteroidota bacterium]